MFSFRHEIELRSFRFCSLSHKIWDTFSLLIASGLFDQPRQIEKVKRSDIESGFAHESPISTASMKHSMNWIGLMIRKENRQQDAPLRGGLAAVEFALSLPLLMILIFGSIEASNAIFLRQAMTITAFETAQVASSVGGTEVEAKARGSELLTAFNIQGATIDIQPPIDSTISRGTPMTVEITAPSKANSIGPAMFLKEITYKRVFTMYRL